MEDKVLYSIKYIKSFIKEKSHELNEIYDMNSELLWRNIYIDTANGVEWCRNSSYSFGRWAIGYNYAYVLLRTLIESSPCSILEFGLGQSSMMINSYINYYSESVFNFDVIEQDQNWIDFFKQKHKIHHMNIYQRDITESVDEGGRLFSYDGLSDVLSGKKYSLISIDGPWGGENVSRIDVIEYIPDILENEFAIIIDDYERKGERRMVNILENKLKQANIIYYKGEYSSMKNVCIIVSNKWKFLTSL